MTFRRNVWWDLAVRRSNPRASVRRFIDRMATRHPELRQQVTHQAFLEMATRDGVLVRLASLPALQRARTFAIGDQQFIRLNRSLSIGEQTVEGMHELCHVWRDAPAGMYYSDELTGGERCEFADFFAWYVTSPARQFFDPDSSQLDLQL